MQVTIRLKDQSPVANGDLQNVYQHPGEPDLLIKVLRPEKVQKRWFRKTGGLSVRRRYGMYTGRLRELQEYIAVRARVPGEHPAFLQKHHGLVETDLGLGMVVGKIKDRSGGLAPTLAQVVARDGLTAELRRRIQELAAQVDAHEIITGDLHQRNILCGWSEARGDQLVIIEGLGEKTFLPVASLSRHLNAINNARHFRVIFTMLEQIDRRRSAGSP